ncbi:unnamed protein product [Bursaphelenchus okinawaensis]|uniref:G_PROTEIN_RECEP_F1_2 domain-containing protein n=1 Tax=Bursaphelenchus okinawaensis TaxID=465554 RepID=A0A811KE60_9BILA|nr:unnamed protein product [Bursaphelenchus okinawaensis]CAG9101549.1 unnamed protein product [Bursaphelenchus okinawaensis]
MILSMIWALVHRCAFANHHWLRDLFENSYKIYIYILLFHIVLTIFLLFIFYYVIITDPTELRKEFLLRVPNLAQLADTKYYVCLKYSNWIRMNGVAVIFLNILIFGGTMYMYLSLYVVLRRNEKFLHTRTAKMQYILFNAVSFQILNYYLMALLPMSLSALSFSLAWSYSEEVATITEALMALHGIIDYFCIVYFITPYRRAVLNWCFRGRYSDSTIGCSVRRKSEFKSNITRLYNESPSVSPLSHQIFELPERHKKHRQSMLLSMLFRKSLY